MYETPWLRESWSLDDVYLHSGGGLQLCIAKIFDQPSTGTNSIYPSVEQNSLVRNETVFALGVALLELAYGRDISHFKTPKDLDKNHCEHALTQFMIADRLTKEVQRNETRRFAFAVGKCICPASDSYDFSLSSDSFRKKFYQDVVVSLREEYEYLFGKAAPH